MLPEEFTCQPLGPVAHNRRSEPSGGCHTQAPGTLPNPTIQSDHGHIPRVDLCAVRVDPFEFWPSTNPLACGQPRVRHLFVCDGEALAPLGATPLEDESAALG